MMDAPDYAGNGTKTNSTNSQKTSCLATMYDGTSHCDVLVLKTHKLINNSNADALPLSDCVVSVKGYVTSEANISTKKPLVCLTHYEVLNGKSGSTL